MATYPTSGQTPWGSDLKAYIDDQDAATLAAIPPQVEAAIEAHVPGLEMGYAERTSTFTTTSTSAAQVTGMSVTVVGTGRPAEIEFYVPSIYHTSANVPLLVAVYTQLNGGTATLTDVVTVRSPVTTDGPPAIVRRRRVLSAGDSWSFHGFVRCETAGTLTALASSINPIALSVVSR